MPAQLAKDAVPDAVSTVGEGDGVARLSIG